MTINKQLEPLSQLLDPHAAAVEADIARWLIEPSCPAELAEAMRYSVLGGGKRMRPALLRMAAGAAGGGDGEMTARAAAAVELVHCYSLVHDDLPAMDDDTLRRGRPTVHVKFGQAMAILAGDALLTRAFSVLAEGANQAMAAKLVGELALAAGPSGMIAGQVADMDLCRLPGGPDGLRFIHSRKTGAMIRAAGRMGAICADADTPILQALSDYSERLGLAFQVIDDVLDVTGSAEGIGKTPGKDAAAGKKTYVSLLGLDEARRWGDDLMRSAQAALAPLGRRGEELAQLAQLLAWRTH